MNLALVLLTFILLGEMARQRAVHAPLDNPQESRWVAIQFIFWILAGFVGIAIFISLI